MEFDQAIYTRGKELLYEPELGIGLGIVASSKMEEEFVRCCKKIGADFISERSEKTAQFVIYREEFHEYVGVSLRPAMNSDGGGANIECRIFVPAEGEKSRAEERLDKSENYCIDYYLVDNSAVNGKLERVQLPQGSGSLKINYRSILNKYFGEQKRLAYFLYKIYPILFSEKDFLLIILDQGQGKEEKFFTIAREITSLIHCLVPEISNGGREYRKRLSYSVNSEKNIGRVNIAYSSNESLDPENRFYLEKDQNEKLPEVYLALAQKAMESSIKYQKFIKEILDKKAENITSKKIREGYFWWKVEKGEKIARSEVPFRIEELDKKDFKDQEEEKLFIKYILLEDDLETGELRIIWKKFIQPSFFDNLKSKEMLDVVEHMILRMYEKSQKGYQRFLTDIPKDIQVDIMFRLFSRNDSCIRKHLEKICTFEEYWDAIELYSCLIRNEKYIKYIQQCSFVKEIPKKIREDVFKTLMIGATNKNEALKALGITWEKIQQDDICSMLFCSWAFGMQEYSIWDIVGIGDLEQYEKIRAKIEEKSYFSKIEEKQLEGEERQKAELNRVCYCLWKQVVEQKRYDLQRLENFEPAKFHEEKEEFFNRLENIVKKRGESQDGIIYLKLELEKEKIWARFPEKAPYRRQRMYKDLKIKTPHLYDNLLRVSYLGKDPQVVEMIQEIRDFEYASQESSQRRNDVERGTESIEVCEKGQSVEERIYILENGMRELRKENCELKKQLEGLIEIVHKLQRQVKELSGGINGQLVPEQFALLPGYQNSGSNNVGGGIGRVMVTSKCDENDEWFR